MKIYINLFSKIKVLKLISHTPENFIQLDKSLITIAVGGDGTFLRAAKKLLI